MVLFHIRDKGNKKARAPVFGNASMNRRMCNEGEQHV